MIQGARFSPKYELPIISRTNFKPEKAIPFNKATKTNDFNQWIHFYVDDYRFECVWKNPKQYLNLLKRFNGVITPDYSLYLDMPLAMQIWNTYRNRALGYWLQSNGANIIPNIRWSDERSYDFAFEGIAEGGTVAVGTNGCIRNKLDRYYFSKGLHKMVEILKPDAIICYSYCPDDIFEQYRQHDIEIVHIENYNDTFHGRSRKVVS